MFQHFKTFSRLQPSFSRKMVSRASSSPLTVSNSSLYLAQISHLSLIRSALIGSGWPVREYSRSKGWRRSTTSILSHGRCPVTSWITGWGWTAYSAVTGLLGHPSLKELVTWQGQQYRRRHIWPWGWSLWIPHNRRPYRFLSWPISWVCRSRTSNLSTFSLLTIRNYYY